MKPHEVREIIECLPKGKTPLYYFKDQYAVWLLARFIGSGCRVRRVKESKYGRLLQKPLFSDMLRRCASGAITAEDVLSVCPSFPVAYRLTLGEWGGRCNRRNTWYQTSRPGKNVVLRLNFTASHNRAEARLFDQPDGDHPLAWDIHPIETSEYRTLSWSRMDIDLARGEALIEEIQNDWLRDVRDEHAHLCALTPERRKSYMDDVYREGTRLIDLKRYVHTWLQPHFRVWAEATLFAAVWFLREEIGLRRIFFNSWETGCLFKGIGLRFAPPRSLYADLPRKFCFEETPEPPSFLKRYWARRLRTHPDRHTFRWFRLDL